MNSINPDGEQFSYVGRFRISPFVLCYGCSRPVRNEHSYCFIGDDSPTYRFYCKLCMNLFS